MELSETRGECCMCGDYGLSEELFQCKVCRFRSQHRYCSNLYPKAESYRVCNWCLSHQQEKSAASLNSLDTSSLSSKTSREKGEGIGKRKPREPDDRKGQSTGGSKEETFPERVIRKRIITRRELEEKLRRTRGEDMSRQRPHGFRNRVRRYKLLDEVSS
ncbi:hypothetical protein SAY87_020106 [Trapa incisa]|uniref:PHD-type zinc finger plants domain-containing protein n=2 Tax=Trapa TaxID=22665 RepID=A0AAN7MBU1_TRANT|nr:hypothetical protein SAY87_020106 [Trapa incisa]KAK4793675.1 hypothetical protein SAY86_024110 [Trapa natans]